ncbi:hypothetical protein FNV43_RR07338 [Rhamnella rubrinervis]|uniref:Uncharacterized protein n=1 Tax=Rhamnella rubrinervis TaxID=2594499 RepID=A0A8K0HGE6_9ROSA|nr:hypothetical protein FNV43_RR07338 [Rhamnella rubrinervis]
MKKRNPIFSKPNMEVISVLEPTHSEMDFVHSIHWPTGRRPYDAPPIVAEKKSNDAAKEINVQMEDNIEHVDTTPHADVSRPSSPITSYHSVQVFTKMSLAKLAGGRRKRRAAHDIQSPYECDTLRRKMVRTLPRSNRTFDPYRPISDDVARQYAQFMNSSDEDVIVEYDTISVKKLFHRELQFSPTWLADDNYNFRKALHNVVSRMRDPELPVRVDPVFALRSFVEARRDLNEIRPILPQLLDGYGLYLETIVDKFGEEMAPYALGLCQNLAAAFWRCMNAAEADNPWSTCGIID